MKVSIQDLAMQLQANILQQKQATGVPNAQMLHGPGGLFSTFGIDSVVVNAHMTPRGLEGLLPVMPTVYTNPLYSFLTGFEGDGASEPSGKCDHCPSGVIESCIQTATFGRVCRSSQEIEINEIVNMINRGETTPLRLLGEVLGPGGLAPRDNVDVQGWINMVIQAQMVLISILFQRALVPMVWAGNPTNNTAGGGYAEFPGLDMLIGTGKIDAVTGVRCAALDSDIKEFNYGSIYGAAPDIVQYMSMLEWQLRNNARGMGLEPVDWVWCMRPETWFELTEIWPIRYNTGRQNLVTPTNTMIMTDGRENVNDRDRMRGQMQIPVNGNWYPVIVDDGIVEESHDDNPLLIADGEFASDISFVPLRAAGMTTLYWETKDWRGVPSQISMLQPTNPYWVSDGGRYMWTMEKLNWCFYLMGKIEPRIILRTPQLAGRIQHVKCAPLQHLRNPFPDSGSPSFFFKGGNESYAAPTYYSEWNPVPVEVVPSNDAYHQ
jgi:hypothetical protein